MIGVKKKLEKLSGKYPELSNEKKFILNCFCEKIKDKNRPDITEIINEWNSEECDKALKYMHDVYDIYMHAELIKTVLITVLTAGLVIAVMKVIKLSYASGYTVRRKAGFAAAFRAIENFVKNKKDGDVVSMSKNPDGSWNYIVAKVTTELPEGMTTDHLH